MIDQQSILDAYQFRHACKEFDPTRKISVEDFAFILETGRLSPSSFGYEPWRFLVIQDSAWRERLKAVTWGAQKQLPSASHYLALLVHRGGMRPDGEHVQHMMQDIHRFTPERIAGRTAVYTRFQDSDFRLGDDRALFDWSCKQAYIALGNMMTSAAMIGIDSCAVEGYDQEAAEAVLAEAGALDGTRFGLAVMVAFGYRCSAQPAKVRQPMADVVRWL